MKLDWKQEALYQRMSDISERCYCAGWMMGNEHTLWQMVANPNAPRRYGMGDVGDVELQGLRTISDEIGGWIYWHDDDTEPVASVDEFEPRFIKFADWIPMHRAHMRVVESLRDCLLLVPLDLDRMVEDAQRKVARFVGELAVMHKTHMQVLSCSYAIDANADVKPALDEIEAERTAALREAA